MPHRFFSWLHSVFFYGHWMVGVIDQPIANALTWRETPPIRWIEPFDHKRYLADPFPWPGSQDTLLCEEYNMELRVGRIAVLKLGDNGISAETTTAFPLPGHLSFPFLFMEDGIVYALPESSESHRLEIIRWNEQSGVWMPHAVVFADRSVADAALYFKNGLFWISYTDLAIGPHDNLNLVYAPALTGPWLRHPSNPVCRGKTASRNGGGIFEVDGRLYRPAQDCGDLYGGALRIMEVTEWTSTGYHEREVTRLLPSSPIYRDGLHTLTAWGDKCLVDGMRLVFSPKLGWRKMKKRFVF